MKALINDLKRVFPSGAVHGRVSELCKPTSRKYDTAVATVLGRNIDSVVVDTHSTGVECMQYLRDKRFGTCTFLPLDTISTKPVDDKFRNYARGARLALDVIEYAPEDERAMLFACGSTLICDDMEIAKQACFGKGQEVKVVTLDGSTIHKSGLMAGGADSRQTGKKWDDHDVATIKKQADHYRNKLRELINNRPKQAREEKLQAELSRLEADLASANDDLSVTKNKLKDIQEQLKHAEKQVAELSAKVEKVCPVPEVPLNRTDEASASAVGHRQRAFFEAGSASRSRSESGRRDLCRLLQTYRCTKYPRLRKQAAERDARAR